MERDTQIARKLSIHLPWYFTMFRFLIEFFAKFSFHHTCFFQIQFNQGFGPMFFSNCFIEFLTGCINFPSETWESIIMSSLNRNKTQHSSEHLTHSMECEQNIMNRSYVCIHFEAIVHFIKRCVSQITRLIWLAAVYGPHSGYVYW